jgi:putative tricarboxylic transport membrane protein
LRINKDLSISLLLLIFCLINYFYLIPTQVLKQGSSANYPYIVISFLTIFTLIYFIISVKKMKNKESDYINIKPFDNLSFLKFASLFLLIIIYVYLIESVGFILISFIFLMVVMIIYGIKDYFRIVIIAILFPIFVSYIFRILLHSILPGGVIEKIIFGW